MHSSSKSARTAKNSNSTHNFRVKLTSFHRFMDGHEERYTLDRIVVAANRAEAIGIVMEAMTAIRPHFAIEPVASSGSRICQQLD